MPYDERVRIGIIGGPSRPFSSRLRFSRSHCYTTSHRHPGIRPLTGTGRIPKRHVIAYINSGGHAYPDFIGADGGTRTHDYAGSAADPRSSSNCDTRTDGYALYGWHP